MHLLSLELNRQRPPTSLPLVNGRDSNAGGIDSSMFWMAQAAKLQGKKEANERSDKMLLQTEQMREGNRLKAEQMRLQADQIRRKEEREFEERRQKANREFDERREERLLNLIQAANSNPSTHFNNGPNFTTPAPSTPLRSTDPSAQMTPAEFRKELRKGLSDVKGDILDGMEEKLNGSKKVRGFIICLKIP